MDLILRKRLNNVPKFNNGIDVGGIGGEYKPLTMGQVAYATKFMNGPGKITMGIGQKSSNVGEIGSIISKAGNIIGGSFDLSSKFTNGASNTLGQIGDLASETGSPYGKAIGGIFKLASNYSGMANYSHSGQEMMNQAGTTESMVNGIGYTQLNIVDTKAAYDDVSKTGLNNTLSSAGTGAATGAAIGSIIPGLGTVAGGIFGGILGGLGGLLSRSKARSRLNRIGKNAIIQTDVINSANMASADTLGLENKYYANNYDTTGGVLYANSGKDLKSRKRINRAKIW